MVTLTKVYQIVANIETFDGDKFKTTVNIGTNENSDLKVVLEKFDYEINILNKKEKIKSISVESLNVIADKVHI